VYLRPGEVHHAEGDALAIGAEGDGSSVAAICEPEEALAGAMSRTMVRKN
jgi:hypothetical protein